MSFRPLSNTRHTDIVACCVIFIAAAFYILTIRSGHNWGGDFSLYISHAINIASGQPYADTGYVFNPDKPFLSPRTYPPVYPLFLAPVYKLFGLDLYAMKIAGILIFALFLLLFYRYISKRLDSPAAQIMVVASVAFSPWFWEAKDQVLPDFMFLLVLYSSIMLLDRLFPARKYGLQQYLGAAFAGLLIYLAYGTRSLGLAILPALFFHDIVRRRMISRTTLIVAAVFAMFYFAQNTFLHTDKSYFDSIASVRTQAEQASARAGHETVATEGALEVIERNIKMLNHRIPEKLYNYGRIMSGFWYMGDSVIPGRVLFSVMTILAVAGLLCLLIKAPSFGDYFVVTYVFLLLIVPFQQERYMLPLVPIYMLYIFRGAETIKQLASERDAGLLSGLARVFPVIVLVIIAASYVSSYALSSPGAIARGVESSESRELFAYIRENTPEDSLFIFHKPRPLALFTGRRAAIYHLNPDMDKLWQELIALGTTHIVLPKYIDPAVHEKYIFPAVVEHFRGNLEVLFENGDYIVYRVADIPALPGM